MSKLYDILTSTRDELECCKKRHNIIKKCYATSCVLNTLALLVPLVLAFQSNVMLTVTTSILVILWVAVTCILCTYNGKTADKVCELEKNYKMLNDNFQVLVKHFRSIEDTECENNIDGMCYCTFLVDYEQGTKHCTEVSCPYKLAKAQACKGLPPSKSSPEPLAESKSELNCSRTYIVPLPAMTGVQDGNLRIQIAGTDYFLTMTGVRSYPDIPDPYALFPVNCSESNLQGTVNVFLKRAQVTTTLPVKEFIVEWVEKGGHKRREVYSQNLERPKQSEALTYLGLRSRNIFTSDHLLSTYALVDSDNSQIFHIIDSPKYIETLNKIAYSLLFSGASYNLLIKEVEGYLRNTGYVINTAQQGMDEVWTVHEKDSIQDDVQILSTWRDVVKFTVTQIISTPEALTTGYVCDSM